MRHSLPPRSKLRGNLRRGVKERRLQRGEHEGEAAQDGEARGEAGEARQRVVGPVVVVEQQGLRGRAERPESEEHHRGEDGERNRHRGPCMREHEGV